MDASLFECFDFVQGQWLDKLSIVDEFICCIRLLCDSMLVILGMSIGPPTNFVHRTGRQLFEFLSVYLIGKSVWLTDELIGRERAHPAQ